MAKKRIDELAKIIETGNKISLDKYIQSEEIFHQAFACLNEKKYEAAIFHFQQSLLLNPNHVQSHGNIALAYSGLGNHKKALECRKRHLQLIQTTNLQY